MDKNIDTQAAHTSTAAAKAATPAERTLPEKFLYIMQLALQLNSTPTKRAETGDKPTVTVHFDGYISVIRVEIYSRGWEAWQAPDVSCEFHLDGFAINLGRTRDCLGNPHLYLSVDQMIAYLETQVAKWCTT